MDIDLTHDTIQIDNFDRTQTLSGFFDFNGYVFTDTAGEVPPIVGVTIDPATTVDLSVDAIAFTDDEIRLDVGGLSVGPSTQILLNVAFGVEAVVLPGDYNGDGFVSQPDLDLVLLNWGDTGLPVGLDEDAIPGGGPFDDLISQNELDGVLLNWGSGTPPSVNAIPEPKSVMTALAGGLVCLRRRRNLGVR